MEGGGGDGIDGADGIVVATASFRDPYMLDSTPAQTSASTGTSSPPASAAMCDGDRAEPGRAALRVVAEDRLEGLERHALAWDRLALASPTRLPMHSHAWVASHLEHFVYGDESWLCLFAYEGDALVGVLPLVRSPHPSLGTAHPVLSAPRNLHTRSGDAVLAAGCERRVLLALFAELRRRERKRFCIEFPAVRDGSRTLQALDRGIRGGIVVREVEGVGRYVRVRGTFDEWVASLSRNFRQNLRQAKNRVSRRSGVAYRYVSANEATEADLDRFLALEASGWKGREGTAILSAPGLRAFYGTLARRLAERGWLEWHFLDIEGRPAAAQMAVRFGRSLVVDKIAYSEEFGRLSPGSLLWQHCAEREFAAGSVDEINWLSDTPWMANWRMERSAYQDVRVFPLRVLPMALGVLPARARAVAKRFGPVVRLVRRVRGDSESA